MAHIDRGMRTHIYIYPRKVPPCTDRASQPQHPQDLGNIEILTNFNMCVKLANDETFSTCAAPPLIGEIC